MTAVSASAKAYRWIGVFVAAAVGLGIFLESRRYFERRRVVLGQPALLKARRLLPKGLSLQLVDFVPSWEPGAAEQGKWVTDQDWDWMLGRTLRCDLSPGMLLTRDCVGDPAIQRPRSGKKKRPRMSPVEVWSELPEKS